MLRRIWTRDNGPSLFMEICDGELLISIRGELENGRHAHCCSTCMPLANLEDFLAEAKAKEHAAASAVALPGAMPMTKEKTDD